MKRLIFTLLILAFAVTAHADPKAAIRRDPVRFYEKSYLIYNAKWKEKGAIRPDYLRPGDSVKEKILKGGNYEKNNLLYYAVSVYRLLC